MSKAPELPKLELPVLITIIPVAPEVPALAVESKMDPLVDDELKPETMTVLPPVAAELDPLESSN